MDLYALLIGINSYPSKPLTQCVSDVGKVETYLTSLKSSFGKIFIKKLLNDDATRKNIIEQIQTFFSAAKDDDVALIYYSGHGAQEETAGLFPDEQDGLLECMVCWSAEEFSTSQLLADKELRYLLTKIKTSPHLVTIFDACHSGDIVRAFRMDETDPGRIKRIAGVFEARDYNTFVFAGDQTVESKQPNGSRQVRIPFKNHVHLAACLSSESSWEDSKGGVFTRYLLDLLQNTKGNLSYVDITRWAKISLKNITEKNQTPTITVQGKGKMNAQSSWLNLYPSGASLPEGLVTNNKNRGWIYSRGSLLGVLPGMNVFIRIDKDHEETVKVKDVSPEDSVLDIPMPVISQLDFNHPAYAARTEISTYSGVKLFINDIDDDPDISTSIKNLLSKDEHVTIVPITEADFFINVFNGMVYFSLPEHEFQPLAEQITVEEKNNFDKMFNEQLTAFIKWHHFYSLDNPAKDYDNSPIQVNIVLADGTKKDVTNGTHSLIPLKDRDRDGDLYQEVQIEITNTSKERLFVGVLTLASDLSITSNPFNGIAVELQPNSSKTLYDHDGNTVAVNFDQYKEIYNWKEEWFFYKIIYNNFEDFTPSLKSNDFLQLALNPPITISKTKGAIRSERGEGSKVKEVKKKWGTCRTRIELANSTYNKITGDLLALADEYGKSEKLSPFIKELYFDEYFNGKTFESKLKQNKDQSAQEANRATDNLIVKLFNYIYKSARRRDFEKQKNRTGPIVVAEGDSWFLYPKPGVKDTLDYIMNEYRLLSLAEAGDEVADYIKHDELLTNVQQLKPAFVLISGGGNDVLGPEIKDILKTNIANGKVASDFLDIAMFEEKLKFLSDSYQMFFKKIISLVPNVRILVHGYDYVRSNPDEKTIKHGWANRYMIEDGIVQPELRKIIITYLVDTFNNMMSEFEKTYTPNVRYVNNRGTVPENEWMDEIHPDNTGFQKVANHFLTIMKQP